MTAATRSQGAGMAPEVTAALMRRAVLVTKSLDTFSDNLESILKEMRKRTGRK